MNDGHLTGKNLVFLVGCPRSGTTWLQRLLAAHPQIKTGQESHLFEYIGPQLRLWKSHLNRPAGERSGLGLPCYFSEEEFYAAIKEYLSRLMRPMLNGLEPGEIFLEKTPGHAIFIREIAELLPCARIIHLVRDPRDVVASLLAVSRSWGQNWAPRQARQAAHLWARHVKAAQGGAAILPLGQFLEVRYESLYCDPLSTLRNIAYFLNLSWADEEIQVAVKANSTNELQQGRGTPIPVAGEHGKQNAPVLQEPKGFVRKARPGSWKEDLTWMERFEVWYVLRKAMPAWRRYADKS